jgi:hypothetical protein
MKSCGPMKSQQMSPALQHAVPQQVVPVPHVGPLHGTGVHLPWLQKVSGAVHTTLHAPQWFGSLRASTLQSTPLQQRFPSGQLGQLPPEPLPLPPLEEPLEPPLLLPLLDDPPLLPPLLDEPPLDDAPLLEPDSVDASAPPTGSALPPQFQATAATTTAPSAAMPFP